MLRLVAQSRAETLLARGVAGSCVGHAYLFLGPSGSGKATAARLFAQAVNCARQPAAERGEAGWRLTPCGECESCRRIAAGTHPEVMEVRPESKGGQNISIEQAREIRLNAVLRPKLGSRRMYVFANAEALSEVGANALLKTLEEPSDFMTLVLCAPNPSQVLPTIRSRCQLVRFGLGAPAEIASALVERGCEPDRAERLARASGGRPGTAISWASDPAVLEQRGRVLDLFTHALELRREAAARPSVGVHSLRLAEQLRGLVGKESKDADGDEGPARPAKAHHSRNLEAGLGFLRDLLLIAQGADPGLAHNQDRLPTLLHLSPETEPTRLLADVEAVREAQQLLDRNVQPQLVFERMFWGLIAG
jgi:DNA polymerase III subunit delta'